MKPDISEFSYGYAVTEEVIAKNGGRVFGAPAFPSLYEEGKEGGGYDVEIPLFGRPLFLQFKLSHCLMRPSAKESGFLSCPYYRMHLRAYKHSQQHKLLLALEAKGEAVMYIAPEFHLPIELHNYYLNKTIISNSAAFRPSDIGPLPDDDEHYVVFEKGTVDAYVCSEKPKQVARVDLKDGISAALIRDGVKPRDLGNEYLSRLIHKLIAVIESAELVREDERLKVDYQEIESKTSEGRSLEQVAAHLARTYFGCEIHLVR